MIAATEVLFNSIKKEIMSRFLYRNLELLEPYEGKLSRTVLRGESSRKGADLPDQQIEKSFAMYIYDYKFV